MKRTKKIAVGVGVMVPKRSAKSARWRFRPFHGVAMCCQQWNHPKRAALRLLQRVQMISLNLRWGR